jgi:hypothetical protein
MKRPIIYDDQIPLTLDLLDQAYYSQEAVALLLESVQRDSLARRYGLEVYEMSSPGLGVTIRRGVATGFLPEEATAYGSRPASTTQNLVKLGYNSSDYTLTGASLPGGQPDATVFVVATLSEVDDEPAILPYYDPSNPGTALSGPGGAGTPQDRRRVCQITFSFEYGSGAAAEPVLTSNQIPLAKFFMNSSTTELVNFNNGGQTNQQEILWPDDRRHIAPYAALPDQNTFTGDCTFTQSVELSGTANLDVGGRIDAGSGITGTTLTATNTINASNNIASYAGDILAGSGNFISGNDATSKNHMVRLGQFIFRGTQNMTVEKGYLRIPTVKANGASNEDFILQWGKIESEYMQPGSLNGYGVGNDQFELTFPNRCVASWASCHSMVYGTVQTPYRTAWIGDCTTTNITVYCAPSGIETFWWAIGY